MNKIKSALKAAGKFIIMLFILFILFWVFYFAFVRSWHITWGADPSELNRGFAGDSLINNPQICVTRGITVKAPPEKIYPWILQIGQGRGGFYSYDRLENLFGLNIHNVYEIKPELQTIKPGEGINFAPNFPIPVPVIEANKSFIIFSLYVDSLKPIKERTAMSWGFLLEDKGSGITRLITRWRFDMHSEFTQMFSYFIFNFLMIEPAHFVMERKMLLTLKNLSEHGSPYSTSIWESETVTIIAIILAFIGILLIYGFGKNWSAKVVISSVLFICINYVFWFWYVNTIAAVCLFLAAFGLLIIILKINLFEKGGRARAIKDEAKNEPQP
jgi:hypothetical protein